MIVRWVKLKHQVKTEYAFYFSVFFLCVSFLNYNNSGATIYSSLNNIVFLVVYLFLLPLCYALAQINIGLRNWMHVVFVFHLFCFLWWVLCCAVRCWFLLLWFFAFRSFSFSLKTFSFVIFVCVFCFDAFFFTIFNSINSVNKTSKVDNKKNKHSQAVRWKFRTEEKVEETANEQRNR